MNRTLSKISDNLNSEFFAAMTEALEEAIELLEDELEVTDDPTKVEEAITDLQEALDSMEIGGHGEAHGVLNEVLNRF